MKFIYQMQKHAANRTPTSKQRSDGFALPMFPNKNYRPTCIK